MTRRRIKTPEEVLNWIAIYKSVNGGNSPTIREISNALGYHTTSAVASTLSKLQEDGKILRGSGARSIIILEGYE
jgi:SOS-response transcriptional repressor LexA